MSVLLRLYPPAWRARYGDEMAALLELRPPRGRARIDLLRGALDAWLRPPTPSRAPMIAAFVGGGLWTIGAAAIVVQPAPPDWPGYLMEMVPLAVVAAASLFVAAVGCLLRAGERADRLRRSAMILTPIGYAAWLAVLVAVAFGWTGGAVLGGAQTLAMCVTVLIGLALTRANDQPIGFLVLAAPVAMLIPWTAPWLVFGAAWTAIGVVLFLDRAGGRPIGRATA